MALGELTMFAKFAYTLPPWATLTGMFLATGAFTLTLAPLSWVVLSELFPNRVRGVAMSLATTAMFTSSYIVTNLFPWLLDAFKRSFGHPGGTFIIFATICVACTLFIWRFLPETKDRSLEEIGRDWLRFTPTNSRLRS
jgi:SP family sugar porter-like MFS transporter